MRYIGGKNSTFDRALMYVVVVVVVVVGCCVLLLACCCSWPAILFFLECKMRRKRVGSAACMRVDGFSDTMAGVSDRQSPRAGFVWDPLVVVWCVVLQEVTSTNKQRG